MASEPDAADTASSTGKPQKDKAPAQDKPSTVANVLKTGGSDPWGVLRWLFGVSITGALIGLGGPFWFDVATKLSTVRQKIRGSKDHKDNDESPKPDEDHKKVIEELVTSSQTTAAKEDVDDETTQQK
jgi:hypothetical protein